MPVTVIVGLQWGDEGKGKDIDIESEKSDLVARFNGGNNAGHTVCVEDKKYALHFLPSGVIRGKKVAIGNGVVLNPEALISEINDLKASGITNVDLLIDERTHVITQELIQEDIEKNKGLGTTGRGIGPTYVAKVGRRGMRMIDYAEKHPEFKPLVGDVSKLVNNYVDEGKSVLLEGAQGALLDIDHGTYPHVTSSNTIAGAACTGLGIGPKKIGKVIGVGKAYITRVGTGPFPTELGTDEQTKLEGTWDKIEPTFEMQLKEALEKANREEEYYQGKYMRLQGREYGTTTGRPRRCGWFDKVATDYACRKNGVDEMSLTKLDVLGGLDNLKICVEYEKNEKTTKDFPTILDGWKPVYKQLRGWKEDISYNRRFEDLPSNTQVYVKEIEDMLNVPITRIGVGPKRDQTILRKS